MPGCSGRLTFHSMEWSDCILQGGLLSFKPSLCWHFGSS